MKKVTRLFDLLELYKDEFSSLTNAFNYRKDGTWISYSARDYITYSNEISLGLLKLRRNFISKKHEPVISRLFQ